MCLISSVMVIILNVRDAGIEKGDMLRYHHGKKGLGENARESKSREASAGVGILDAGDHEAGWWEMPRGHMIAPPHFTRRANGLNSYHHLLSSRTIAFDNYLTSMLPMQANMKSIYTCRPIRSDPYLPRYRVSSALPS